MRDVGRVLFFFFQAEDGIRDYKVTGVQTCALPISERQRALDQQSRPIEGVGEKRRQQQGRARAEQRGQPAKEGSEQTDTGHRLASAPSMARTKSSVGCAPSMGTSLIRNAGVLGTPIAVP